ncbi:MAG: FISUMP domain-containing protein, partial [Bacteroidota bacterium]|nr:FISUMP domain-containing protein [Bacteroidota bacterium]
GVQGIQGLQGLKGDKGDAGINGKTAYQQWLDLGNTGTESNFIASLKGIKGDPGLQGLQGIQGVQGLKGDKGDAGINGKTAYQQWLDLGNTGTESDFIASLKGIKGDQGVQGIQGVQGLKGDQGVQGIQGLKGDQGDPGVAFDNTQVLTDKTWTSSMINSSLSLKANIVNVYSKTNMQTAGQAQLHWNNITNKPTLFDGTWSSLTGKPSTLAGYGITDAAALGHIHNNATSSISGFMSFGDKMKLDTLRNYTHPATHDWSILINTPFNISSPIGGQLLKYNTTTGKWENWTPNYLSVENQQLSLTNNQLTISGAGGNTISFTNWDTDKTDDVVITGNQTIAGNKTFSGSIIANNTILANNGVNANNKIISNIAAPVANTDAVPKMYVDSLVTSLNLKIQVLQGVPVNQLMTAGATPAQLITAGAKVSDIVAAGGTVNGLTGTAIDLDGNTFKWIGIGNQVWMAENLKSIHYRNGDPIPNVTDITAWASLTTGAYCNYNNDISNVGLYGRLYNNYTVMDSRNVSPIGWHVPSKTEFLALEAALGGDTLIGGRMKEVGTLHWHTPNVGATNSSKFLGLPSGNRHDDGTFNYMTICGCFQSSTEYEFDSTKSYHFHLLFWRAILESVYYSKTYGLSIRCIKD